MRYLIRLNCVRNNHEAFLELEKKFRRMLQELSLQQGGVSRQVESVKIDNSYEIRDSERIVEHEQMIDKKRHVMIGKEGDECGEVAYVRKN